MLRRQYQVVDGVGLLLKQRKDVVRRLWIWLLLLFKLLLSVSYHVDELYSGFAGVAPIIAEAVEEIGVAPLLHVEGIPKTVGVARGRHE